MNRWGSIQAGLIGALLAPLLWILWRALPSVIEFVRLKQAGATSGDVSVSFDTNQLLLAAGIGFAGGWFWRARRQRR